MRTSELRKYLAFAGIIAPLFYFILLTLLGYLWDGYSPVRQSMSEIGSVVSPYQDIMNYLGFSLLGIMIGIFGACLYKEHGDNTVGKVVFLLLLIAAVCMFLVGFYPCDAGCVDVTSRGRMHSLVSTPPAIAIPVAAMLMASTFTTRWGIKFGYFSFVTGLFSLSCGPIMLLSFSSQYLGLIQRIGIGLSLLWIFTVSVKMVIDKAFGSEQSK